MINNIYKKTVVFVASLVLAILILKMDTYHVWSILAMSLLLGITSIWLPVLVPIFFGTATLIIPSEILPFLAGTPEPCGFGAIRLHPLVIAVFVGSFFNVMLRKQIILDRLRGSRLLFLVVIMFAVFNISILFQTFFFRGLKGIPQCLENYTIPFCFFLFLLTLTDNVKFKILKMYTFCILLISIYGLIEYFIGMNFLYEKLYVNSGVSWYFDIFRMGYRITTSLGHPLKNATYFLFAIPIGLYIFRRPFNIFVGTILCLAIFATGSRIASLLAVLSIVAYYTPVDFSLVRYCKAALITGVTILIGYLSLLYTPIGRTVIHRFFEAQTSAYVRLHSLINIKQVISGNIIFGKGMGTSAESSELLLGRVSTFENPWIMLIADAGVLTTCLYCVAVIIVVISNRDSIKHSVFSKAVFTSFIFLLLMMSSYGSFGSRNTLNLLLWFNIALLYQSFYKYSKA